MNADMRSALFVLGCGFIGIIMASIEYVLVNGGILLDEFVTGSITLPDLMSVTIIIWVIVGVIIAVVRS